MNYIKELVTKGFLVDEEAKDIISNLNEDDFKYTWSYFEETRKFFEKAGRAGRAVIFTVEQ